MKKFITPFLFLYLLSATVSGNVDIVAIDGIPFYYEGYILSHLHQEEPGIMDNIGDMYTHFIWSTNSEGSYDFSISALGSSSSEAVGLWTDSAGVRFYSVFVDSICPLIHICIPVSLSHSLRTCSYDPEPIG